MSRVFLEPNTGKGSGLSRGEGKKNIGGGKKAYWMFQLWFRREAKKRVKKSVGGGNFGRQKGLGEDRGRFFKRKNFGSKEEGNNKKIGQTKAVAVMGPIKAGRQRLFEELGKKRTKGNQSKKKTRTCQWCWGCTKKKDAKVCLE